MSVLKSSRSVQEGSHVSQALEHEAIRSFTQRANARFQTLGLRLSYLFFSKAELVRPPRISFSPQSPRRDRAELREGSNSRRFAPVPTAGWQ